MTSTRSFALCLLLSMAGACGSGSEPDHHEVTEYTADPAVAPSLDCGLRQDTGYDNGRSFSIGVVTVDRKPVERQTANAFDRMRRAARADGVDIVVVSGFRTNAEQTYFYGCFISCNCNNCNGANAPGYSNHQSGSALDLNTSDPGVYGWLARNAARFDFHRTVADEDWHWEYFGGIDDETPCTTRGASASAVVRFTVPTPGSYTNGLWMKVAAGPSVHHVAYRSDGVLLGASEDRRDDFSSRYSFSNAGAHRLEAIAFDASNRELGRATVDVTVVAGGQPRFAILSPADQGWFTNGVWLTADAGPEVVTVVWSAGGYELGRSTDRAQRFARRAVFNTLGWRVITAVGLDGAGREVMRRSTTIRVVAP